VPDADNVTFVPPVPLPNTTVSAIVGVPDGDQLVFVLQVALSTPVHVYVAAPTGTALVTRSVAIARARNRTTADGSTRGLI
jgi:hypothetical protein